MLAFSGHLALSGHYYMFSRHAQDCLNMLPETPSLFDTRISPFLGGTRNDNDRVPDQDFQGFVHAND